MMEQRLRRNASRTETSDCREAPLEVAEKTHLPSRIPVPVAYARKRKTTKGFALCDPDGEAINPDSTAKRVKRSKPSHSRPKMKNLRPMRSKTTVNDAGTTRIGRSRLKMTDSLSVSQEIEEKVDVKVGILEVPPHVAKELKHEKLTKETKKPRGSKLKEQLKDDVKAENREASLSDNGLLDSKRPMKHEMTRETKCNRPDDQSNNEQMKEEGKRLPNLESSQIKNIAITSTKQTQRKQTKRRVQIKPKRARERQTKGRVQKTIEEQTVLLDKAKGDDSLSQYPDDFLDVAMETDLPPTESDRLFSISGDVRVDEYPEAEAEGCFRKDRPQRNQTRSRRKVVANPEKPSTIQIVNSEKDDRKEQPSQKRQQSTILQSASQSHENSPDDQDLHVEKEPKSRKKRRAVERQPAVAITADTNMGSAVDGGDAVLDSDMQPSKRKVVRDVTRTRKTATNRKKQRDKPPVESETMVNVAQAVESHQECTVKQRALDPDIDGNYSLEGIHSSHRTRTFAQTREQKATQAQVTTATVQETQLVVPDDSALQPTETGMMEHHTASRGPVQLQPTEISSGSLQVDLHSGTDTNTKGPTEQTVLRKRSRNRKAILDQDKPIKRKKKTVRRKDFKQSQSLQTGGECSVEQIVANTSASSSKDHAMSGNLIDDGNSRTKLSTVKTRSRHSHDKGITNSNSKSVTQISTADNKTKSVYITYDDHFSY